MSTTNRFGIQAPVRTSSRESMQLVSLVVLEVGYGFWSHTTHYRTLEGPGEAVAAGYSLWIHPDVLGDEIQAPGGTAGTKSDFTHTCTLDLHRHTHSRTIRSDKDAKEEQTGQDSHAEEDEAKENQKPAKKKKRRNTRGGSCSVVVSALHIMHAHTPRAEIKSWRHKTPLSQIGGSAADMRASMLPATSLFSPSPQFLARGTKKPFAIFRDTDGGGASSETSKKAASRASTSTSKPMPKRGTMEPAADEEEGVCRVRGE
jgi:hypothetical protein